MALAGRLLEACALSAAFMLPYAASAQAIQGECACMLPLAGPALPVGEVASVTGDVAMTQSSGYVGLTAGAPILQGSVIRVGLGSSAGLRFQDMCWIEAKPGSTVSVLRVDGGTCVSVAELPEGPDAGREGGFGPGGIAAVVAVAAGAGVALAIGGGGDDDAEPSSP
jgi:hypothetical protein